MAPENDEIERDARGVPLEDVGTDADPDYDPATDPYNMDDGDDLVAPPPAPPETISPLEILLDEMAEAGEDAWGYVNAIVDRDTPTALRMTFYPRWIAMVATKSLAERDMLINRGRQVFVGVTTETMRKAIEELVQSGVNQRKTAPSVVCEDFVAEMISTPQGLRYLVYKNDGTHEIQEMVQMGDTNYTLPLVTSLVESGSLLLATGVEEYDTVDQLRGRLRDFIRKYVHLPEEDNLLAAQYAMSSWHGDRIPFAPYLYAIGSFESGKSRLLDALAQIVHRGLSTAGSLTVAVLFRALDLAKATLIIDEADFDARDPAWPDIKKILLLGSQRHKAIMRTDMDAKGIIRAYDPFGRKIFGGRLPLADEALLSRGISIHMEEDDTVIGDVDLDLILPDEFFEEVKTLRNQLLLYRLRTLRGITVNTKQRFIEQGLTSPRVTQMAIALLADVDEPTIRAAILKRLKGRSKEIAAAKTMEPEALFITALLKVYDRNIANRIDGRVAADDVRKEMVKSHDLDDRAQVRDVTRLAEGIKGITKKRMNDGTYFLISEKTISGLRRRLGHVKIESARETVSGPSKRTPVA